MAFENNLTAAGQAIAAVRQVCLFGAANKPRDVERGGMWGKVSKTKLMCKLAEHEFFKLDADMLPRQEAIPIDARLGGVFRAGTCETQASIAFELLRKLQVARPLDFMATTNGAHAFLVIGRTGDAAKWQDWGADAVVCDPWLNECPMIDSGGVGPGWEDWPFRPSRWAGCDLVLGAQTPRKLSAYEFESQYRLDA